MTPILCRSRGFLSKLRGNQIIKLFSTKSDSKEKKDIISIEGERGQIKEMALESKQEAPSFLPTEDFPYNYKPMSIFEEVMGTIIN